MRTLYKKDAFVCTGMILIVIAFTELTHTCIQSKAGKRLCNIFDEQTSSTVALQYLCKKKYRVGTVMWLFSGIRIMPSAFDLCCKPNHIVSLI